MSDTLSLPEAIKQDHAIGKMRDDNDAIISAHAKKAGIKLGSVVHMKEERKKLRSLLASAMIESGTYEGLALKEDGSGLKHEVGKDYAAAQKQLGRLVTRIYTGKNDPKPAGPKAYKDEDARRIAIAEVFLNLNEDAELDWETALQEIADAASEITETVVEFTIKD